VPKFFFSVDDGYVRAVDSIGLELANFTLARSEAIRAAGEMLADIDGALKQHWEMTVTDVAGNVLLRLHFSASEEA
jgi:hypothetical protein